MAIRTWTAFVLAVAVSSVGVVASRPGAPRPPEPATPPVPHSIGRVLEEAFRTADGTLQIANGSYRARFDAHGVHYTPRVGGQEAPRQGWAYTVRGIETATTSRRLVPVEPEVSALGDHIVEYRRPGLIERYEGEPAGVEQIFVLTERPAGRGDVRIRGDVAFSGTRRTTSAGLEFAADGQAPFTYAHPIAFDADRRSLPVRAELRGDGLDLVLDGDALAGARWPVTIDPLFGIAPIEQGANLSDVAYNVDRGEFLVVFMRAEGAGVNSLRGRRYREDGNALAASFPIEPPPGESCGSPAVDYDRHADRYLVVFGCSSGPNTGGVRARLFDSAATPIGSVLMLTAPGAMGGMPRVAARNGVEHAAWQTSFAVVWRAGADVGELVRAELLTATGVSMGEFPLDAEPAPGGWKTADVAFAPSTDRFLLVWDQDPALQVWARSLTPAGILGTPVQISEGGEGEYTMWLGVAHDPASRRFLVTWDRRGQLVNATGSAKIGNNILFGDDARFRAVGAETGTFVLAYTTPTPVWYEEHLHHRRLLANGVLLADTTIDTKASMFEAALASSYHGDLFGAHLKSDGTGVVSHGERWWSHAVHGRGGDFDGDGRSDLFFYRRATGMFHVKTQTGESAYAIGDKDGIPLLVEIDGDGLADIGVFDRSSGQFIIRKSTTQATEVFAFGTGGDIPVPGDYLGDSRDELAVYRPSTFAWYILPSGQATPTVHSYGVAGGIPTPADWNGDGKIELGVWGAANGTWYWSSLDFGEQGQVQWGQTGDIPLQGNFVGSAHADQVVYRRQEGRWHIRDGQTGGWITNTQGDGIPMPLDWNGDGRLDLGLFQWENQRWLIRNATAQQGNTIVSFGGLADVPAGTGH